MSETDNRYTCTKENPWTPEKGKRSEHPDAVYIRDIDYGDGEYTEQYKCPNCGLTFEQEGAQ